MRGLRPAARCLASPDQATPIAAELQKLFRDPLVGNLWMLEVKHSDATVFHYYSRHEPERHEGSVRINYLAGFNLEEKPQSIRDTDVSYSGRAPQTLIAERASELLSNMSQRDWEKNFTTILNSVAKEDRLDPILRISLLQRILKTGVAGSSALADGFSDYKRELDQSSIDLSVNWMDPRDGKAQSDRKRAEVFLGGLSPMESAIRNTASKLRQLREPIEVKYEWIGWLSHGSNNSWAALVPSKRTDSGVLTVLVKPAGKIVAEPIVIGDIQDGNVRVHDDSSGQLLAGRPVFLKTKFNASK